MRATFSACLLLVFAAVGCTSAPEEAVVDDSVQKEADMQALQAMADKWDAASVAGDLEAIAALVTDDFVRMPQDEPATVGKEAYIDSLRDFFETYSLEDSKNEIVEARICGDRAAVSGNWRGTVVPKAGGEPFQATGKWIDIRERQADGTWKFSQVSANSDAPWPALPEE